MYELSELCHEVSVKHASQTYATLRITGLLPSIRAGFATSWRLLSAGDEQLGQRLGQQQLERRQEEKEEKKE